MLVYEEYKNPAQKRAAQKGAKRGKPTGKAPAFIFVYHENGVGPRGMVEATVAIYDPPTPDNLAGTSVSRDYLRTQCRRVGAKHLPPAWRKRYDYYRKPD